MRSQTAAGEGRKSGPMRPAPVAAAQAATRIKKTEAAMAMKPARPIRAPMRNSRRRRRIGAVTYFAAATKRGSMRSAAETSSLRIPAFFAAASTSAKVLVEKSPWRACLFSARE